MYCPAKFIRDDVIAPFLQLYIVSVSSRKCNDDDADYNDDDDNDNDDDDANNNNRHHDYYINVLK